MPVMVHDSWLQMASTAVNPFALVRASRNTPAVDSTSAAPPRSVNADPATATCTPGPVNRPGHDAEHRGRAARPRW